LQQNTKLSVYQLLQETDFVNQFPVVLIKTYLTELYILFVIKLNSLKSAGYPPFSDVKSNIVVNMHMFVALYVQA